MSSITSASTPLSSTYTGYPTRLSHKCFVCHAPIHRVYATSGHTFLDFFGIVREVRGQYQCDNPMCPASVHPMNPSPIQVLPYKRYSLNVWRWIAQEYKIYHQNAAQIALRIQLTFNISFNEGQIQRIMDEIDVMISHEIDQRTRKLLMEQGVILLALDGQKPDGDGNALWIFVDLISNRVLKVSILNVADAHTLHNIIEEFLKDFEVKLIGIVSDKQNNLKNLHDTYYSEIPHQYCQFHFLQNLWNHIEVKDSHLHKSLAKMVNDLNILSMSVSVKANVEDMGDISIRTLFAPIETDLRRILRTHTTKFTKFRGIKTFELLEKYLIHLSELVCMSNQNSRLVSLLHTVIATITNGLETNRLVFQNCTDLFSQFKAIQDLLNDESEESLHVDAIDTYFITLWGDLLKNPDCPLKSSLRTFLPQKDTSYEEILREWVRLYDSYKPGLFSYFKFPISVKTSSLLEANFSQEKGEFRRRSGRGHVGYMVRTRGEFELKRLYVGQGEVREIVDTLGIDVDRDTIKQGLIELSQRKSEETMDWSDTSQNYDGWKAMGTILSRESKPAKRGRKKK